MDEMPLYQEIAESIRQGILYGRLSPDDELPSVREMSAQWHCAPGTVQRAYKELTRQGLVVSRPGAGTRVSNVSAADIQSPLRKATLVNQAESFLLHALTAGYRPEEIEQALGAALDRWRATTAEERPRPGPQDLPQQLRFVGSHDPAVSWLSRRLGEVVPDQALHLSFAGSLGGLMALARHEADIAGCHLWDEKSNIYNRTFVQHLMPGWRVALLRLADRRLGLITAPGNPLAIKSLADLVRPGVRFINRQEGAGTRVWLEAQLRLMAVQSGRIEGFKAVALTHLEVARAIASDQADAGIGIETAALAYNLDFVTLTTESYDLVIPEAKWHSPLVQALVNLLLTPEANNGIATMGGYDTGRTGSVEWVG